MADDIPPADPRRGLLVRLAPLIVLAAATATVIALGGHHALSLAALVEHRAALEAFVAERPAAAVLAYAGGYAAVVALSLPGGAVMTVLGGFLFGVVAGTAAAVVAATAGAAIVFLVARTALGDVLGRRAGPALARLADGFRRDAFAYLLFLRLVPAFPFWLVNLAPALLGMRTAPFVAATALGILPGTAVFALVGDGLGGVLDARADALAACRAAGRVDCAVSLSVGDLVTPELLGGLAALGLLALVPVVARRLRRRAAEAA